MAGFAFNQVVSQNGTATQANGLGTEDGTSTGNAVYDLLVLFGIEKPAKPSNVLDMEETLEMSNTTRADYEYLSRSGANPVLPANSVKFGNNPPFQTRIGDIKPPRITAKTVNFNWENVKKLSTDLQAMREAMWSNSAPGLISFGMIRRVEADLIKTRNIAWANQLAFDAQGPDDEEAAASDIESVANEVESVFSDDSIDYYFAAVGGKTTACAPRNEPRPATLTTPERPAWAESPLTNMAPPTPPPEPRVVPKKRKAADDDEDADETAGGNSAKRRRHS